MISAHYGVIPRLMTIPPAYFRRAVLEGVPYPVRGIPDVHQPPGRVGGQQSHVRGLHELDFTVMARFS
jgi:hypothetical protein